MHCREYTLCWTHGLCPVFSVMHLFSPPRFLCLLRPTLHIDVKKNLSAVALARHLSCFNLWILHSFELSLNVRKVWSQGRKSFLRAVEMQYTCSYIHNTKSHFLSLALSARQTIDLQRQTPGLCRWCVLACTAVHSGSVKRACLLCLVGALHLLGFFFFFPTKKENKSISV